MATRLAADADSGDDRVLRFMRLIWSIDHELERVSKRMETTLGLTVAQRMTLLLIAREPGISAGGLAALMHMHPGTMSGIVKRLEAAGFIQRSGHEDDARRLVLKLTPRGQAANRQPRGTFESTVRSLIKSHSPSDVAATERVLAGLAERLRETAADE